MLLSHENHFRFGYNGVPFNQRTAPEDQWFVEYGPCKTEPKDFGTECLRAAHLIRASTTKDLWVLLSGGIDSEIVLRSFVEQKILVRAAILRFKGDLNVHDISYAVVACEELGVDYRFFDLDLDEFFNDGRGDYYSELTQCLSPQLLPTMWCMDQIEGYPILGSGDCYLVRSDAREFVHWVHKYQFRSEPSGEWELWEKEKVAAWYRFLLKTKHEGCAGFFQYTPEIMAAFLADPLVVEFLRTTRQVTSTEVKVLVYQKFFNIRSRKKYNGYEKAMDLDSRVRPRFETRYGNHNSVFTMPLTLLRSGLLPKNI